MPTAQARGVRCAWCGLTTCAPGIRPRACGIHTPLPPSSGEGAPGVVETTSRASFPLGSLVPLEEVTFRSRCPFENVDFGKIHQNAFSADHTRAAARATSGAGAATARKGGGRGCTEHCEVRVLRLRDMRGSAAARAGRGVRGEPPLRVSTYNACLPERGSRGAPRALPGEVYKFEERIQQAFRCSAGLPHTLVWRACLRFTSSSAPDASNFRIGLGPPVTTRPGVYMS